jgi:hypothetical protein
MGLSILCWPMPRVKFPVHDRHLDAFVKEVLNRHQPHTILPPVESVTYSVLGSSVLQYEKLLKHEAIESLWSNERLGILYDVISKLRESKKDRDTAERRGDWTAVTLAISEHYTQCLLHLSITPSTELRARLFWIVKMDQPAIWSVFWKWSLNPPPGDMDFQSLENTILLMFQYVPLNREVCVKYAMAAITMLDPRAEKAMCVRRAMGLVDSLLQKLDKPHEMPPAGRSHPLSFKRK